MVYCVIYQVFLWQDNFRDENSLEDGRKKGMTSSRVRTMTQRINESSSTVTPSAPTVSTTSTLDSSSKYHLRKSTVAKSSTSKKHTIDSANRHGGQVKIIFWSSFHMIPQTNNVDPPNETVNSES